MTWDRLESNWAQCADSFSERFEQLTEEELSELTGNKAALLAKLESAYGYSREEAETHLEKWKDSLRDELEHVPTSTSGAPTY